MSSLKPIRKAVFPVAGLGTRFLPATKAIPKELLPIVDRPLIQSAVDEAREVLGSPHVGTANQVEVLLDVRPFSKLTDRTREIALEKDIRVHLEPRKGYGRAYRTGFDVAKNDIIVTMDADCTYPAELVPELVKRLLDDNLDFITCDRLSLAEDGSMSGLHGFGNWVLSFTARMLFWYGIKDSQTGMWVFRKSVFDNEKMRPTNDGMPLSEEIKILARRHLGKKKAIEISVPYRPRVGEAEIHTWGDGWKNLKFLFARRFGLHRTRTPWGGLDSNPDSDNGDLPEQKK